MFLCLSLNNDALELILRGDFKLAVAKLEYALAIVSSGGGGQAFYDPQDTRVLLPFPVTKELEGLIYSKCNDSSPDNMFHVCERGFAFQEIQGVQIEQSQQILLMANPYVYNGIVMGVILYNLALATHGLALSTGTTSSPILLRHALSLYENSLATLFQFDGLLLPQEGADSSMFLMMLALLANMGHLMSHFWIDQGAAACLSSMENYRRLPLYQTLSQKDIKFFNQAVVLGRVASSRCRLAAAA